MANYSPQPTKWFVDCLSKAISRKEINMSDIKVTITLDDDLAGCEIQMNNKTEQWENLDKRQQIHVCNSFVQFYNLFSKSIKEDESSAL